MDRHPAARHAAEDQATTGPEHLLAIGPYFKGHINMGVDINMEDFYVHFKEMGMEIL